MLIIMMTMLKKVILYMIDGEFTKQVSPEYGGLTFPSHQSSQFPLQTIIFFNTSPHHSSFKEPSIVVWFTALYGGQ